MRRSASGWTRGVYVSGMENGDPFMLGNSTKAKKAMLSTRRAIKSFKINYRFITRCATAISFENVC